MTTFTVSAQRTFANGAVYALRTEDDYPIETTDTFLPMITRDAEARGTNELIIPDFGSRRDRWMIGVSVMSGCPVRCPFCATGALKKWRNLKAEEILAQVDFIVEKNKAKFIPAEAEEFRILFTRMGEPVMNKDEVVKAVCLIKDKYPNATVALSTVGPKVGTREFFKAIKGVVEKYNDDFVQFQFSVHSTDDKQRDFLQPVKKYQFAEIKEFADEWKSISDRKVTLNFTLCDDNEFDAKKIMKCFSNDSVFIKLSPLNENDTSSKNHLSGVITAKNLA